jgi:hypothetical protein
MILTTTVEESGQTAGQVAEPDRFTQFMRKGEAALADGQPERAHRYWQQAALIDPNSEDVWLALLRTVQTGEDRATCLRNILSLNPDHAAARKMLADPDLTLDAAQQQPAPSGGALLPWLAGAALFGALAGLGAAWLAASLTP